MPPVERKEWEEPSALPKCMQDFEGDFVVECYMAMFLMFRNHLWRVLEAVGPTGARYRDECRRVKQVMLVITPNTMVYFARGSNAFQYLGPKVGYSANLCDAEYPYHFYCEAKDQTDVLYARIEWLDMEGKSDGDKYDAEKADKRGNPYRYQADVLLTGLRAWDKEMKTSENFFWKRCRRRMSRWIRQPTSRS